MAAAHRLPSKSCTVPDSTKNDSEIMRWKWVPGPAGSGPMSHRHRPNSPLVEAPVVR